MAYFIYKGEEERQEQFIVDTPADIAKLPTSTSDGNVSAAFHDAYHKVGIGSVALCLSTGDIYVLATNNSWTKAGG